MKPAAGGAGAARPRGDGTKRRPASWGRGAASHHCLLPQAVGAACKQPPPRPRNCPFSPPNMTVSLSSQLGKLRHGQPKRSARCQAGGCGSKAPALPFASSSLPEPLVAGSRAKSSLLLCGEESTEASFKAKLSGNSSPAQADPPAGCTAVREGCSDLKPLAKPLPPEVRAVPRPARSLPVL